MLGFGGRIWEPRPVLKRSELGTRETADLGAETMGAETVGAQIVGATIMDLAGAIEDLEAMMTPEAVQQARTQAAAAPPLSAESPDRRRPYAMGGGFVGDVQREECDQLSWGKTP